MYTAFDEDIGCGIKRRRIVDDIVFDKIQTGHLARTMEGKTLLFCENGKVIDIDKHEKSVIAQRIENDYN